MYAWHDETFAWLIKHAAKLSFLRTKTGHIWCARFAVYCLTKHSGWGHSSSDKLLTPTKYLHFATLRIARRYTVESLLKNFRDSCGIEKVPIPQKLAK